jgi:hypothetical protein
MTEVKPESLSPREDVIEYDTYEDRLHELVKTVPVSDEILYYPEKIVQVQIAPKQVPKGLLLAPVRYMNFLNKIV